MMYPDIQPTQQLQLPITVKEELVTPARKRVAIVSVKLVKEGNLYYANRTIRNPRDGAELCRKFLGSVDREHFVVLCLNVKNQPTHINIAHVGSLNASVVHPREVYKPAVLANAASIMAFHNHPSGNPDPSPEDIEVTHRLHQVGEYLGIQLIDHIIIGDEGRYTSLRERGVLHA